MVNRTVLLATGMVCLTALILLCILAVVFRPDPYVYHTCGQDGRMLMRVERSTGQVVIIVPARFDERKEQLIDEQQ